MGKIENTKAQKSKPNHRFQNTSKKPTFKTGHNYKFQQRKNNDYVKKIIAEKVQRRAQKRAEQFEAEKAERERAYQEKKQAINEYKKKRLAKQKALCKKTKRGQPLMKDRMQLLLKEIQEMKHQS